MTADSAVGIGFPGGNITSWKDAIAPLLQGAFESRYSDHRGGDYWNLRHDEALVQIIANEPDPYDGDLPIWERPDLAVLVTCSGLTDDQVDAMISLGGEVLDRSVY